MSGESIKLLLENLEKETVLYENYVSEQLVDICKALAQAMEEPDYRQPITDFVMDLIHKCNETGFYITVYLYSFLVQVTTSASCAYEFLKYITQNPHISKESQYYLYYQLSHLFFTTEALNTPENKGALWNLFNHIFAEYKKIYECKFPLIPQTERNENLIVVLTAQYLTTEHGPTKTALDRCHTIVESMHKQVLLINTAECLTKVGCIPFFNANYANYASAFLQKESEEWKGVTVPFFQCDQIMPDSNYLDTLLGDLYRMKPAYIVDIGGSSILGNLCTLFTTTLGIGLCPSELTCCCETYQALGKPVDANDRTILSAADIPEDRIIESIFTSGLKSQQHTLTAHDLNLDESFYNILVVGTRLDSEVTEEFLSLIQTLPSDRVKVNFCGYFNTYESMINSHPELNRICNYIGFQSDILAVLDCVDLYINPTRRGGGTSCVEALSKGIPVITEKFGDVYSNAGDDFAVQDYEEMHHEILHYLNDPSYYCLQSKKAVSRSNILLETDSEFERILQICHQKDLASYSFK